MEEQKIAAIGGKPIAANRKRMYQTMQQSNRSSYGTPFSISGRSTPAS